MQSYLYRFHDHVNFADQRHIKPTETVFKDEPIVIICYSKEPISWVTDNTLGMKHIERDLTTLTNVTAHSLTISYVELNTKFECNGVSPTGENFIAVSKVWVKGKECRL